MKRAGLETEQDAIIPLAQPSFHIARCRWTRVKIGASHFGGRPHLPGGTDWPLHDDELMTFVGQIKLADLTDTSLGLPDSGWLAFFVGGAEATGSEHAVIYVDGDCELVELAPPAGGAFCNDDYPIGDPVDGVFPAAPIKFSLCSSLPPFNMDDYDDDKLIDGYIELHSSVGSGSSRLRGYPYCDGDAIDDQLFRKYDDWTLLLQVDSFEPVHAMCWWDNGKLSYLIRESDLKRRDFSRIIAYIAGIG